MARFDVAGIVGIHVVMGAPLALVFDDALALAQGRQGEHAVAVDV